MGHQCDYLIDPIKGSIIFTFDGPIDDGILSIDATLIDPINVPINGCIDGINRWVKGRVRWIMNRNCYINQDIDWAIDSSYCTSGKYSIPFCHWLRHQWSHQWSDQWLLFTRTSGMDSIPIDLYEWIQVVEPSMEPSIPFIDSYDWDGSVSMGCRLYSL